MWQASSQHWHARPHQHTPTSIGMLAPTPAFAPALARSHLHPTCSSLYPTSTLSAPTPLAPAFVRICITLKKKRKKNEKNTRTRWGMPRTHRNNNKHRGECCQRRRQTSSSPASGVNDDEGNSRRERERANEEGKLRAQTQEPEGENNQ